MAKLTREQKIEIYNLRIRGITYPELSLRYDVHVEIIKYLVRLIEYHGVDILRKDTNRYYSKSLKNKQRYGYRRIALELINQGITVNHKKVKRLLSKMNLFGLSPKRKYKSYTSDHNDTTRNLLLNKVIDEKENITYYQRIFDTNKCNQIWGTDVTQFNITSGKLYLSPIIDFHNREIISYDISTSPNFSQITNMLNHGLNKYKNIDGLILHSDQGWQYQMKPYKQILESKNIIQSMSRKGNCLDNSPTENFFARLKSEMFYGKENTFKTLSELKVAIVEYIDYYNNQRIITKLKGMSPIQYRKHSLTC